MEKPNIEILKKYIDQYKKEVYKFPPVILVELNTFCNLNCIMCPQDKLTRSKGNMDFNLWKKIIDEVKKESPGTEIWPALMGEPFALGKDLFKYIKYASLNNIKIFLNTNLLLFKEEYLDDLFNSGIQKIIIGMDGIKKETYEKIRVNSDYDKFMKKLKFILNERKKRNLTSPEISLQYIVMEENYNEEEEFIEYWENQGFELTLKIKRRTGWSDGVKPDHEIVNLNKNERIPCTWLLRQMTIFWNGLVPQCDGDWNGEKIEGDVKNQTIKDIWNGSLKKVRDMHLSDNYNFWPCNVCEDWQAGRSLTVYCKNK